MKNINRLTIPSGGIDNGYLFKRLDELDKTICIRMLDKFVLDKRLAEETQILVRFVAIKYFVFNNSSTSFESYREENKVLNKSVFNESEWAPKLREEGLYTYFDFYAKIIDIIYTDNEEDIVTGGAKLDYELKLQIQNLTVYVEVPSIPANLRVGDFIVGTAETIGRVSDKFTVFGR